MPNASKKTGYSKKDWRNVSDNPELTQLAQNRTPTIGKSMP